MILRLCHNIASFNANGVDKDYLQCSFLPERVVPYWNKLPSKVKNCLTVLSFKIGLESFKKNMISKCIVRK